MWGSGLTSACLLVSLGAVVSACGPDAGSRVASDCQSQVRVDGAVFTSYTVTRRAATPHASAQASDCDDTGPEAAGTTFPDDPTVVETWAFAGFSPEQVLGVSYEESGSYAVFVADSLPRAEREAIYDAFAP